MSEAKVEFSSRQRIADAVAHRASHGPAVGFRASWDVIHALKKHYGVDSLTALMDVLPVDTYGLFNNCNVGVYPDYIGGPQRVLYPDSHADGTWDTIYGYKRKRVPCSKGTNEEVIQNPLGDAELEELGKYEWPQADWFDYSSLPVQCEAVGDRAIVFLAGSLWQASHIIGFERMLMDMLGEPEVVEFCLEKLGEFFVEFTDRTLEAAGDSIDIICVQDDLGTQESMLINPELYRHFFKPWHKRIFEMAHKHGAKVMFHSCGAIYDYVPEFIEIGVDILDPVQLSAKGMVEARLLEKYGEDISFHGGLSTTGVMVNGTPDDVKREIDRLLAYFNQGNGYIIAPSHYFTADSPLENILAYLDHLGSLKA